MPTWRPHSWKKVGCLSLVGRVNVKRLALRKSVGCSGKLSVAGPVLAGVFGPQTGVQKNNFSRSLEGALCQDGCGLGDPPACHILESDRQVRKPVVDRSQKTNPQQPRQARSFACDKRHAYGLLLQDEVSF